jgi:thiamine-phosphate pyrophosphorylase
LKSIEVCRLYGILDLAYVTGSYAPGVASQMIEGGIDLIQLRAKTISESAIAPLAGAILAITQAAGVPLIINDFPRLVSEVGAQGAHVGQDDMSIAEARRIAGPGAIIGKSTHSVEQAVAAEREGADYIGFGPLFATPTKPDYKPIGIDQIRRVHELMKIPIFCIGGIKRENLPSVLAAGARRIVIVSGILLAADVTGYCRDVKALLKTS